MGGDADRPFPTPGGTIPPSGKAGEARFDCDDVRWDAIKEAHHYFDLVSLLTQIGRCRRSDGSPASPPLDKVPTRLS